ncbi:uncharacterized protein DS421_14g472270 [Arachis hypogaea]|nr:uncharacterized protein DS421_14g472270 [Arachis hypogaea]
MVDSVKKNGPVVNGDIISFAAPPQHDFTFSFVFRENYNKELGDVQQKHAIEDLNERLSASMQSYAEANAIIKGCASESKRLKGLGIGAPEGPISLDDFRSLQRSNTELRKQLENQVVLIDTLRNDNRVAADRHESELQSAKKSVAKCYLDQLKELQQSVDLKYKELGDVNRVTAEQKYAIEDLNKRLSASMQSCAEANAIISRSQRERCLLVETLRSKLEDTRQKMVVCDNKVRQLETELHEKKLTTANQTKKIEELEEETRRLSKDLESEKINAAMRDLDFERRRLRGARERLMLRETQLRAFYSTTEEIQVLFAKQQEQLKAMQKTLEDEENYENTSVDMDGVISGTPGRERSCRIP